MVAGFKFSETSTDILCPYCKSKAELKTVAEHFADVNRYNLDEDRYLWICYPCDAFVLCHHGTRTPLGFLASKELRARRREAHNRIDRIKRHGLFEARHVYEWLAQVMGYGNTGAHIAEMDEKQVEEAIGHLDRIIEKIEASL